MANANGSNNGVGGIENRAMLVSLNIRQWSGIKQDRQVTAEVCESHGATPDTGRFTKALLARSASLTLRKLIGEARNTHYSLTLPWSDDGFRIISNRGFMRYREAMNKFKDQILQAAEEFDRTLPDHIRAAEQSSGTLFEPEYWTDYLTGKRHMADHYGFDVHIRPVPTAADFRVEMDSDEKAAIQDAIKEDCMSGIESAMQDVAQRIRVTVQHMADRLRAYQIESAEKDCVRCKGTGSVQVADSSRNPSARKVQQPDGTMLTVADCPECSASGKVEGEVIQNAFRDSLVGNVRELVEILPSLNLTHDANIDALISDMQAQLIRYDAQDLRLSPGLRNQTAKAADDILRKMAGYGL